jgi:transcriptional regulator with XRE-family HTH domain
VNFLTKLKELRIQNNLKLQDVADYLGVSPSAVSRFETGEREPNFENLIKLTDFYKVTTDYLLGRSNIEISGEKQKFNAKEHSLIIKSRKLTDKQLDLILNIMDEMI